MKFSSRLASLALTLVASLVLTASSAFAGFTANTGTDLVAYTGPGLASSPQVGGVISALNQPLANYAPDTAADPQILPGDIDNFLFSYTLTVNDVNMGAVNSAGTYSLSYDIQGDGIPDILVSSGNATLFLSPLLPGQYVATGQLTQVTGPANPAFRDLAYGNNANFILEGGLYTGGTTTGTNTLVLRQNATAVPEPTTMAAVASLGGLFLRRRRAA
jgi:hypothetical protein